MLFKCEALCEKQRKDKNYYYCYCIVFEATTHIVYLSKAIAYSQQAMDNKT